MQYVLLVNPPLLAGEVEIDLSDCYEPDPLATVRGDARSISTHLRIERLIAARRREIAKGK